MSSLFTVFLFGHYGRNKVGSAGPANIVKHRSAPSGMKRVQKHNLQELWSGFERPLVAICRYPLFFVLHAIYMTSVVFWGPLRKEKNSSADPIIASCNIIGFWALRHKPHFSCFFQMGSRPGPKTCFC